MRYIERFWDFRTKSYSFTSFTLTWRPSPHRWDRGRVLHGWRLSSYGGYRAICGIPRRTFKLKDDRQELPKCPQCTAAEQRLVKKTKEWETTLEVL